MAKKIDDNAFLSTLVYRNLEWSFGQEGKVQIRRQIHDIWERGDGRSGVGSHAEGLRYRSGGRIQSVDFTTSKVYINILQISSVDENKCRLLLETDTTPPGFCKLRVVPGLRYEADLYYEEIPNRVYLSSEKFLERCRELSIDGTDIKGFSLRTHGYRTIYSFRIPWPSQARAWIDRNPHRSWPSINLVQDVVREGCCLIPCSSRVSNTQWRICFGLAEKLLVYSFSQFVFVLYQFLRIVVNDIITKPKKEGGGHLREAISSYVVKTVFFWTVEESLPNIATEERFGAFFDICLTRLSKVVSSKNCPNYFIPGDNLFEHSLDAESQSLLLERIHEVRSVGLKCVLQCDSFETLKGYLEKSPESLAILKPNSHSLELLSDKDFFVEICSFSYSIMSINGLDSSIQNARSKLCDDGLNPVERTFLETDAIDCSQSAGLILYNLAQSKQSNKERYPPFIISRTFLSKKIRRDIAERALTLATFLYLTGNYAAAQVVLSKACHRFKPYVIYNGWRYGVFGNEDRDEAYKVKICGRGWTLRRKTREAFLLDFQVFQKKPMIPRELRLEVEVLCSKPFGVFRIPSFPYAYFLEFLCLRKSAECCEGDLRGIISELQAVLYDEEKRGDYMVSHAMAGMCLEMMGEDAMAVETYVRANRLAKKEKRKEESNTALWRIALLLNKKFSIS